MPSAERRTDRTPYIVLAISFVIAAVGGYYGSRETDGGKVAALSERLKVLEETIPLRRQMRDTEMAEIRARLNTLEAHR